LVIAAAGVWAVFVVESQRRNLEDRHLEAQRQAAFATEAFQAWRYAARYETFAGPNEQDKPERNKTLSDEHNNCIYRRSLKSNVSRHSWRGNSLSPKR
jgi:hypothetical protein